MGHTELLDIFTAADQTHDLAMLQRAIATALVKAATLDGVMDAAEQGLIHALIGERLGLSSEAAETLLAQAAQAVGQNVELPDLAQTLVDSLSLDDRVRVLEMLWEVVYADGMLHDYEADMVQRAAGALQLPDKSASLARRRAQSRMGVTTGLI